VEVKSSVQCRKFAACKRSIHLPWKSHAVGKIGSAISSPCFPPSLIEVSHVAGRGAPLKMTGETKSGAQRACSYDLGASVLQGPGSALYSTLLYSALVQTLRLCTGRTAHRVSRSIALLRLCTGRTAHRGSTGIALMRLCTGRTVHRGSRGIALLYRHCTGRTAHRGSRGIALLFHDHSTRRG
jgi:hypothetical protein